MWMISEDGFLSIVEWNPKKNRKTGKFQIPASYNHLLSLPSSEFWLPSEGRRGSHLLVRARVEADLNPLFELDPYSVYEENPSADYRHRLTVRRKFVKMYFADLLSKLDYDSHVKETVRDRAPKTDSGSRYNGMMEIWSATNRWQKRDSPPYSNYTPKGSGVGTVGTYKYDKLSDSDYWKDTVYGSEDWIGYGSNYRSNGKTWLPATNSSADTKSPVTPVFSSGSEAYSSSPSSPPPSFEGVIDPETGVLVDRDTMKEQLTDWLKFSDYGGTDFWFDLDAFVDVVYNEFGWVDVPTLDDATLDSIFQDHQQDIVVFDNDTIDADPSKDIK